MHHHRIQPPRSCFPAASTYAAVTLMSVPSPRVTTWSSGGSKGWKWRMSSVRDNATWFNGSNALDGNPASSWGSAICAVPLNGETAPYSLEWLAIDLGSAQLVKSVSLASMQAPQSAGKAAVPKRCCLRHCVHPTSRPDLLVVTGAVPRTRLHWFGGGWLLADWRT